jgi:hypothetical protein
MATEVKPASTLKKYEQKSICEKGQIYLPYIHSSVLKNTSASTKP